MASNELLPRDAIPKEADSGRYRFGRFEFDMASGELRKGGSVVRLRQQPARLLTMLLSRPGSLVSREELRARLWSSDTFVDFDQGLNYCVKEIRAAIGDNADAPVFIETLPRRGYRWIGPRERIDVAEAPGSRATAARPALRLGLAWLAGLAMLAVVVVIVRPDPPSVRTWKRVTFRRGVVTAARFVPEGQIAYTAAWDGAAPMLYSAALGAPEPRVVRTEATRLLAVSRRGEAMFVSGPDGEAMLRMPLGGGPSKELAGNVRVADVAFDGERVAAARQPHDGTGVRLEFPLGRILLRLNSPGALRIAPDGARLAVIDHPTAGDDAGYVLVVDREGQVHALGGEWSSIEGLAWTPDGEEVWLTASRSGSDTSVFAIRVDSGEVRLVLAAGGRLVLHDISHDRRLLLERATSRPEVHFGRQGEQERELTWLDGSSPQDLSADGSVLLLTESGEGGGPESSVYVRPTNGSPPLRLSDGRALSLASDGRNALVRPAREAQHVARVPIGAGEVRFYRVPGIVSYLWAAMLPDGRLLFSGNIKDHNMRVWLTTQAGAPRPITPEQIVVTRQLLSPDGRLLVARCPPERTCLYSIEGGSPPTPIEGLGAAAPLGWDAASQRLFVAEHEGASARIVSLDPLSGQHKLLFRLAPKDPVGVSALGRILVTPDGCAWAYGFLRRLSELYVVEPVRQ